MKENQYQCELQDSISKLWDKKSPNNKSIFPELAISLDLLDFLGKLRYYVEDMEIGTEYLKYFQSLK